MLGDPESLNFKNINNIYCNKSFYNPFFNLLVLSKIGSFHKQAKEHVAIIYYLCIYYYFYIFIYEPNLLLHYDLKYRLSILFLSIFNIFHILILGEETLESITKKKTEKVSLHLAWHFSHFLCLLAAFQSSLYRVRNCRSL